MYGLILPTEVSIVNLGITFNVELDAESSIIEFDVGGLVLKPPSPEALLSILEEASEEIITDDLTLTFEGISLGDEYVEIQVPDETTEPFSQEPQKVVWTFADLENLDKVSFEVKETPSSSSTPSSSTPSSLTSNLLIPAVGVVAVAAAAVWYFTSRRS
jgi:hypothetical protein